MQVILIYWLFFFITAFLFFASSLFFWRRKRFIENLPRSKIRSMAMGLVDLAGTADGPVLFTSPFSQTPCVFYRYEMQEMRTGKGGSYWGTVLKGGSDLVPFYLGDETGRVLVDPKDAKTEIKLSYSLEVKHSDEIPELLSQFLDAAHYHYENWFGQHCTMRFCEYTIAPGDALYVMGVCQSNRHNLAAQRRHRLNEVMRELKSRPDLLARFDTDQNRDISQSEWEVARNLLQTEIETELVSEDAVLVGKHGKEIFLISSGTERDLVSDLHMKITQTFVFGCILMLFGVAGILFH